MKAKKKSLKEGIEYRLGLYFGLQSGALHTHNEKYGDKDQIMKILEHDISRGVRLLLIKELGIFTGENQGFKELVSMYKDKLK